MTLPLPPGTRLPARAVWLHGQLVRGEQAALSVFDRGARDGGALFETVRVEGGEPVAWERHMERLVLSAAELGFPVPPSPTEWRAGLAAVLEADGLRDAVARLTVTRGVAGGRPVRTGWWIEAETLGARLWPGTRQRHADGGPLGASAIVSRQPFAPGWLGRHKTTSRMAWDLAREEGRAAGVDETLLVSPAGELLEGAASNLFVVGPDGVVRTPPVESDVLPGVMRARVLLACAGLGLTARVERLQRTALDTASELFVTNSVQEVLPLRELEGRPLHGRAVALRLLAAVRGA